MNRVLFSSQSDNWKTPDGFYQALNAEFNFDYDPCPLKPIQDGLAVDWGDCNFVNPPYSQISRWVEKAYQEHLKGKTVVLLIPSRTDTRWWHNFCMKATEIRFIKGRMRFNNAKANAPFPSCLVIFLAHPGGEEGEHERN